MLNAVHPVLSPSVSRANSSPSLANRINNKLKAESNRERSAFLSEEHDGPAIHSMSSFQSEGSAQPTTRRTTVAHNGPLTPSPGNEERVLVLGSTVPKNLTPYMSGTGRPTSVRKEERQKLTPFGRWYASQGAFWFKNLAGEEAPKREAGEALRRHFAIKKVVLMKSKLAPETIEEARLIKEKVSMLKKGPGDGFGTLQPLEGFEQVSYSLESNSETSTVWCKAEFCCKPEDVVAYRFDEELWGHEGTKFHVFDCTDRSYKVRCRVKIGGFFKPREFLMQYVWKRLKDGSWCFLGDTIEDDRYKHSEKYLRGKFMSCMLCTPSTDGRGCNVTHAMQVDVGLPLPTFIVKQKSAEEADWLAAMACFFAMSKSLEEAGITEGVLLGETLVKRCKESNNQDTRLIVKEAIKDWRFFKNAVHRRLWIVRFLSTILHNKFKPPGNTEGEFDQGELTGRSMRLPSPPRFRST